MRKHGRIVKTIFPGGNEDRFFAALRLCSVGAAFERRCGQKGL